MKDFKQIDAVDVISHLSAGKKVYGCILYSRYFNEGLKNLQEWTIGKINKLIKEENVVFFEKVEETK